jgi:hypothetical protein
MPAPARDNIEELLRRSVYEAQQKNRAKRIRMTEATEKEEDDREFSN